MGVGELVLEQKTSLIKVSFSGDVKNLPDFNRDFFGKEIEKFIVDYGDETEISDIDVYVKKFDSSYFGKPLIFCSFAANTSYGIISVNSIDWGVKRSLRACLKSLVLETNKLAEKEIYGQYLEVGI